MRRKPGIAGMKREADLITFFCKVIVEDVCPPPERCDIGIRSLQSRKLKVILSSVFSKSHAITTEI